MTAAPSSAATVSTASAATAGMSTASAAAGMSTTSAANAAAPATARGKGLVSRSRAAKCASVSTVIPTATAPAAIDIGRVVARPTTPISGTAAPPSAATARAVTTRHQSCEEQRCKERHFPTADRSRFHFDKMLSDWRLTNDTKNPDFKSEPLGDCAASGHLEQTLGAQGPSRVSSGRHHQDRRDRQLRIATAAANQVVALAVGFEPELSNRGWIVDQLDPYIAGVGASFQSFTR